MQLHMHEGVYVIAYCWIGENLKSSASHGLDTFSFLFYTRLTMQEL